MMMVVGHIDVVTLRRAKVVRMTTARVQILVTENYLSLTSYPGRLSIDTPL